MLRDKGRLVPPPKKKKKDTQADRDARALKGAIAKLGNDKLLKLKGN